ncbi:chemotaxis protein CheD [bacterium]|nr:chemotaxis protein CheD [bacterium]
MRHIVGVADMKLATTEGDIVVTHALGSCIGVAIYDPVAHVGGILHYMLPESSVNPQKAAKNPWMFADTAIPRFFKTAYELGASKSRLIVKVAGGAQLLDPKEFFAIGKRNHMVLRKLLWKNGIMIRGENTGGTVSRTMFIEIGGGRIWITMAGQEVTL